MVVGSRDNTDGKFVIDWLYDEIYEIINPYIQGNDLFKKTFLYVHLLGNGYTAKECSDKVYKWRRGDSLFDEDAVNLWEVAKKQENTFLGIFEMKIDDVKTINSIIDKKLGKYITHIENYENILNTINKKIAVLIICEMHNNILSYEISSKYKFYETNSQRKQLKEFLELDGSEDNLTKVIDISGPLLSGKHTLVYDVLNELHSENLKVINIKEFQNDIINDNIKIEAEKVFSKHEELKKIELFKGSSVTEKLDVIGRKSKIVFVIDCELLGNVALSIENCNQIWNREDFKIIIIKNGYYETKIKTRLYSIEELYEMLLIKLKDKCEYDELSAKMKIQFDNIICNVEGKLRDVCDKAVGHPIVTELLSSEINGCITDKIKEEQNGDLIEKDIVGIVEDFLKGRFNYRDYKFRINDDKVSRIMRGKIKKVYKSILDDSKKDLVLLMSFFDEYPIPLNYIFINIDRTGEELYKLWRLGWIIINNGEVIVKIPFDFVMQVLDEQTKNRVKVKIEKIIEEFMEGVKYRNNNPLRYYTILSVMTGIGTKVTKMGIDNSLLDDFFYMAIVFFADLKNPFYTEYMLDEYKKICEGGNEKLIKLFELLLLIIKGEFPYNECISELIFTDDEVELKKISVREQILLLKVIQTFIDGAIFVIVQILSELKDRFDSFPVQYLKNGIGKPIWTLAKRYIKIVQIISIDNMEIQEKLAEGYHYAVMGICLMNGDVESEEIDKIFKYGISNEILNIINYIGISVGGTAEMIENRINMINDLRLMRIINIIFSKNPVDKEYGDLNCDNLISYEMSLYLLNTYSRIISYTNCSSLKYEVYFKSLLVQKLEWFLDRKLLR